MSRHQRNFTLQTYTYRDPNCTDLMPPEEMDGVDNPIPEQNVINTCVFYPGCVPYNISSYCTYEGKEQLACIAFPGSCNCSGIGSPPFHQAIDACTPNPNNDPLFGAPALPAPRWTKTIRVYNATGSNTTDNTASTNLWPLLLLLVLPVLSVILAVVFLLRRKQGGSVFAAASTPSADDFDNIDWGLENDQHDDGGHGQEPAIGRQTTAVVEPTIPKQARQESAAAVTSSSSIPSVLGPTGLGLGPLQSNPSPVDPPHLALSLLDTSVDEEESDLGGGPPDEIVDSQQHRIPPQIPEESDLETLSQHRIPHRIPVVANGERTRQHLERMQQSQRKRMNGY